MLAHRHVLVVCELAAGLLLPEDVPADRVRAGSVGHQRYDPVRPLDHLLQRFRILGPEGGEIILDLGPELRIADRGVPVALDGQKPWRKAHVDDRRSLGAHGPQRRLDDPGDPVVLPHEVARDPDAGTLERTGVEKLRVVGLESVLALLRRGVGRIDAGHDPEHRRDIVHVTTHGTRHVERDRQRNDPVVTEQAVRRTERDDAIVRRGAPDGAAGVGADAQLGHGRGDGDARPGR